MYKSNIADISVLVLGGTFRNKDIKAMDWNVTKSYDVGMDIVYSGYPSWHKLMSFNGRVAGYEKLSSGMSWTAETYRSHPWAIYRVSANGSETCHSIVKGKRKSSQWLLR